MITSNQTPKSMLSKILRTKYERQFKGISCEIKIAISNKMSSLLISYLFGEITYS